MKRNNKKGFTLAELLIVVAIIAVLVAIAIPVFTSQLEKAKEATAAANLRSAYAAASVDLLEDENLDETSYTYGGKSYTASGDTDTGITVTDGTYSFDGNEFKGFTHIDPGNGASAPSGANP